MSRTILNYRIKTPKLPWSDYSAEGDVKPLNSYTPAGSQLNIRYQNPTDRYICALFKYGSKFLYS
ncbi:MAG: hypothetical protein LAO31_11805 [Acidobacteriia bacterium]|nr:hypothetical protein [Terriglobia bacterium]